MSPAVPTCAFACKLSQCTEKARAAKRSKSLAPLTTLQVFDSQK